MIMSFIVAISLFLTACATTSQAVNLSLSIAPVN